MSRYDLDPVEPNRWVTVGWDPPLQTYFAQVFETPDDPEEDEKQIVWRGFGAVMGDEIRDLGLLMAIVKPHVKNFPAAVSKQLILDRARNQ